MAKSKLHPIAAKHGFKSNEDFYKVFPDQESYERAMGGQHMAEGGPMNAFNTWAPDFANPEFFMAMGGAPCYECGGAHMEQGGHLSKEYIKEARKKPGGSNVGKYNPNQTFAGPSGGAPKGSYPIGDIEHARSALKLAHNAPNPSGIKAAVYRKYPSLKKEFGGDVPEYQTAGTVIPGYDPNTGVHMLAAGQASLTPGQLTGMGYTQPSNNPNWYNQETGRFYKTIAQGQPGYTPPTPTGISTTNFNPTVKSNILGNTNYDTSSSSPIKYVNTGKTFSSKPILGKGQEGGTMTDDLQGTYPMFNSGGGSFYENVNTGYYAYGGDPSIPTLTEFRKMVLPAKAKGGPAYPGETQTSIIDKNKNDFMSYLRNNVDEDLLKKTYQDVVGPQFQKGGSSEANVFWSSFADMFSPYGRSYSENIPLNYSRGYELSNKDYSRLHNLTDNSVYKGVSKVNYGPMARLFGKAGRRMFGPRSIEFDVDTPYEDRLQMNPNAGALIQYEQMQRAAQNKNVNPQVKTSPVTPTFTPSTTPDQFIPSQARQQEIIKMRNSLLDPSYYSKFMSGTNTEPNIPFSENVVGPRSTGSPSFFQKYGGLPQALTGNNPAQYGPKESWEENDYPASTLKPRSAAFDMFSNYANENLKASIEQQEKLMNPATGKLYDREKFKLKSAFRLPPGEEMSRTLITGEDYATSTLKGKENARREKLALDTVKTGDYLNPLEQDPSRGTYTQFGMIRPDQKVPVQFQGQNYNFNQYGAYSEYGGTMKGGGEIVPNFWNASQLNWPLQMNKFSTPDTEVHNTLKAVPRHEANLEAEGGETAIVNQGGIPAHFKITGPRHTQGGVPLNLPENSFIFSDTKSMRIKDPEILAQFGMSFRKGGYTPAEIAKKYDVNKYRQILADPDTTSLQRKTAEMMIANMNLKLAKLGLAQESKKGFPQGIPAIAMPYIESMKINPADMVNTQAQPEQPDADNMAKFGGLIQAQNGYVQGKPVKTTTYAPFWGGEDWVKFDQPITMPDGDVLYELPQSEWNKFQEQGYLDVASAPFSRGTFRDVANNPWAGDIKPGDSPKSYRILTQEPKKVVSPPHEVPVGTTYKEGNKTYKVVATDRYEDGAPAYRVQEISDPDKSIGSYFSSYAGHKVVPAEDVKKIVNWSGTSVRDKAYEKELAERDKIMKTKGKAANVLKPGEVNPNDIFGATTPTAAPATNTVTTKQEGKKEAGSKKQSMHINDLTPEEKALLGIK